MSQLLDRTNWWTARHTDRHRNYQTVWRDVEECWRLVQRCTPGTNSEKGSC